MSRAFLAVALVVASACATAPEPYRTQSAPVPATPNVDLARAIVTYVEFQGWDVVHASNRRVEALTPTSDIAGMRIRERFYFDVRGGRLTATKRTEVQMDSGDGPWQSSTAVCEDYAYVDEKQHLEAIVKRLGERPAEVVAQ